MAETRPDGMRLFWESVQALRGLKSRFEAFDREVVELRLSGSRENNPERGNLFLKERSRLLDDIGPALRNARRAMQAWDITVPPGFNQQPENIPEAKLQLELLMPKLAGEMSPEADALMREVELNEQATAQDSFSQEVAKIGDREAVEGPKLIVRFVKGGDVWPIEKECATILLFRRPPIVELAKPDELKADRQLVEDIKAIRKRRDQLGVALNKPRKLVVRFRRHGDNPLGHSCEPGEVWEVDEEAAYGLLRGRSPLCELATDADLKSFRDGIIAEPSSGRTAKQPSQRKRGRPEGSVTSDPTDIAEAEWQLIRLIDELPKLGVETPAEANGETQKASTSESIPPGSIEPAATPTDYVIGWADILQTLNRDNNATWRGRVERLNDAHNGPIIKGATGQSPTVVKPKLIAWWNSLEEILESKQSIRTNAEATVEEQYAHGRDATVVPEISGQVKKRRSPRGGSPPTSDP